MSLRSLRTRRNFLIATCGVAVFFIYLIADWLRGEPFSLMSASGATIFFLIALAAIAQQRQVLWERKRADMRARLVDHDRALDTLREEFVAELAGTLPDPSGPLMQARHRQGSDPLVPVALGRMDLASIAQTLACNLRLSHGMSRLAESDVSILRAIAASPDADDAMTIVDSFSDAIWEMLQDAGYAEAVTKSDLPPPFAVLRHYRLTPTGRSWLAPVVEDARHLREPSIRAK